MSFLDFVMKKCNDSLKFHNTLREEFLSFTQFSGHSLKAVYFAQKLASFRNVTKTKTCPTYVRIFKRALIIHFPVTDNLPTLI